MTRIPDYPYRVNPLRDPRQPDPGEIPPLHIPTWVFALVGAVLVACTVTFFLNIRNTGAGPDHQCRVQLFEDHSWRPLGWTTRGNWPPPGCNFVVTIDQGETQ